MCFSLGAGEELAAFAVRNTVPPVEVNEYGVFFSNNFIVLVKGSIDTVTNSHCNNLSIIL